MGENKASYLAQEAVGKIPEGDQKVRLLRAFTS